jgi:polyketide cyclase/dehydrase/lipid transport protein
VAGPVYVLTNVDIRRPPEAVWPFLVAWEELPRWMEEMREVRLIGAIREGVGVEAEAIVRIGGITTRDRIRVTRWEPPVVLELVHLGWVSGTGYMELSPTEEGSRLFWREALDPPWGPLGRLGMRCYRPLMRRVFRRDLERLRDLVERTPG